MLLLSMVDLLAANMFQVHFMMFGTENRTSALNISTFRLFCFHPEFRTGSQMDIFSRQRKARGKHFSCATSLCGGSLLVAHPC